MEWHPAIQLNHAALKRILAMLLAMARLSCGEAQNGQGSTLPRHLYRAVLSLLRPAEAATRRLIIALARQFPAPPVAAPAAPAWQPAPPKPEAPVYVRSTIGMHCGVKSRFLWKAGQQFPTIVPILPRAQPTRPAFALLDPQERNSRPFPEHINLSRRRDTPIDATRINLRLRALTGALDDLPAQAERFARWHAQNAARGLYIVRDAEGQRRLKGRNWPLRSGKPPGCRLNIYDPDTRAHYRSREVDRVASHCHALADHALRSPPDTS